MVPGLLLEMIKMTCFHDFQFEVFSTAWGPLTVLLDGEVYGIFFLPRWGWRT